MELSFKTLQIYLHCFQVITVITMDTEHKQRCIEDHGLFTVIHVIQASCSASHLGRDE